MGVVIFETSRNSTLFGSRMYYTCKDPLYQIHPRINSKIILVNVFFPFILTFFLEFICNAGTYICGETGEWTNKEIGTKLPSCLPGELFPFHCIKNISLDSAFISEMHAVVINELGYCGKLPGQWV